MSQGICERRVEDRTHSNKCLGRLVEGPAKTQASKLGIFEE